MKTEKLKLSTPKTMKHYSYRRPDAGLTGGNSTNTDVTTTCTTVTTTTHFNKL